MSAPNTTLYIKNLNDHVRKDELRAQLYALFTTYGKILDVIASKNAKMRGQAFLVFADLAGATTAMRACEGTVFYDKPMHIEYAKTKSYAILQRDDPNFVHPTLSKKALPASVLTNGLTSEKRQREDDDADIERSRKREKSDDDGDEMEIEDEDDEKAGESAAQSASPPVAKHPTAALLCTNLPQEVTDDVLSVLFQQYQGFQTARVSLAPPDSDGTTKNAHVAFDSPDLAAVAKEALDGFTLKKGWVMSVQFV
ncbi:hypothetical protein M422DRAFT_22987 [Sphaerobolus stellatus SS14]|nr:hypothetical protein M422DRAFT_22987 [Sphaerobolus stellatus SS14]